MDDENACNAAWVVYISEIGHFLDPSGVYIHMESDLGCFLLCQRFRKFRKEFKWKGPFRFLPTRTFGITSGGGPLISVGIFRPKFAVPFLKNSSLP